jgi:hypothetical protein
VSGAFTSLDETRHSATAKGKKFLHRKSDNAQEAKINGGVDSPESPDPAAGNRFARDDKEPGPSWGKQLPGERPRETAET